MHIAFVTPAYVPLPGGGERYVAALAGYLAAAGHHVSVVTSCAAAEKDLWLGCSTEGPSETAGSPSVDVVRRSIRPMPGGHTGLLAWRRAMVTLAALPGNQSAVLFPMARFMPWLDGLESALDALQQVDIVHTFNVSWESAMVVAYRYARQKKRPLVITPFAHFATGPADRVARNSTMDHQMTMLREADRVLVLTPNEQEGLEYLQVNPNRIGVIGGGLDPLPDKIDQSAYAPGSETVIEEPFALFIGRSSIDKGAIYAAEAIRQLNRKGRAINLLMVGSPTVEFERYYDGLDPAGRAPIRQFGRLDDADKHALLKRCAMLLLPSRSESLGIVVLEAWAHGRPVIGARAGALPEVIDEGETGLLVDFGDVDGLASAIEQLLDEPQLAAELGRKGQGVVQRDYQWEAVTDRVLIHYNQLIDEYGEASSI